MALTIQIIQAIYSIYITFNKKKKNMIFNMVISNLLSVILYITVFQIDALISSIIIAIRNIVFLNKDKCKTNLMFYICFIVQIIGGIIAMIISKNSLAISILPMLTAMIACFVIWFSNEQGIRFGTSISNLIWVIYNFSCGIYITGILNLVGLITTILSYIYYKEKGEKLVFIENKIHS